MDKRQIELSERLLQFAADAIRLTFMFPKNIAGKHIGSQLVRSASSMGANYEEGRAAQSRPDFIHKLHISFKETMETIFWLRLAEKLELIGSSKLASILQEGHELRLILGKSLVTAKGGST